MCHGDNGVGPLAIRLPVGQLFVSYVCVSWGRWGWSSSYRITSWTAIVCHEDDEVGPLAIGLPVGQLLCVMRTMGLVP